MNICITFIDGWADMNTFSRVVRFSKTHDTVSLSQNRVNKSNFDTRVWIFMLTSSEVD